MPRRGEVQAVVATAEAILGEKKERGGVSRRVLNVAGKGTTMGGKIKDFFQKNRRGVVQSVVHHVRERWSLLGR